MISHPKGGQIWAIRQEHLPYIFSTFQRPFPSKYLLLPPNLKQLFGLRELLCLNTYQEESKAHALVGMVLTGLWLDLMASVVFSNFYDSVILRLEEVTWLLQGNTESEQL